MLRILRKESYKHGHMTFECLKTHIISPRKNCKTDDGPLFRLKPP